MPSKCDLILIYLIFILTCLKLKAGDYEKFYNTLNLFAFGTYRQYLENKGKIIDLSPIMDKKLKHLTILTLATQRKTLPYDDLMTELDIKNVRHLEDLIIEAIYAGKSL